MSGPGVYDLKDETQAKEYLDNLGVEYRYQCYKENLPDGCHRLADYLEAFKRDVEKARKVYETNCVEHKYGHSCFKAGNYSLIGRGGEQSADKALEYFQKGCGYEHSSSCHNAGLLVSSGKIGKDKDFVKAGEYMQKGCDLNYGASCQELSTYYIANRPGFTKDMGKAFEYATKACDLGHMYACANLSVMYKKGDGVKQDFEMAEKIKKRAQFLYANVTEERQGLEFGK